MNENAIIYNESHEDDARVEPSATSQPLPSPVSNPVANKSKDEKKSAIRHAEKRRTSTCRFADRVAQLSVDHYRKTIPKGKRPSQTCIATILAHYRRKDDTAMGDHGPNYHDGQGEHDNHRENGILWILSMGVGTKFLSESCLRQELENESEDGYGSRVRDMHAEVLARRAFRRQLTLEIQDDLRILEENDEGKTRSLQGEIQSTLSERNTITGNNFHERNDKLDENMSILVRSNDTSSERRVDGDSTIRYMLRPGVTLHMYTSSAPCGNATLKKFCKMSKERFRDDLGPNEWPDEPHEPPPGHSIKLGEFSLLLKRDNNHSCIPINVNDTENTMVSIDNDSSSDRSNMKNECKSTNTAAAPQSFRAKEQDIDLTKTKKRMRNEEVKLSNDEIQTPEVRCLQRHKSTRRGKPWPATLSDDWAPPGTTIVGFWHKGSIHSCSDKICRWNYLGLQGSLLASILEEPLYLSTLTVGRKLSGSVCRRAICCRLDTRCRQPKLPTSSEKIMTNSSNGDSNRNENKYRVNHPAVLGTSVYLDTGVVDTSNVDERGQDVRFHSSFVWSWWSGLTRSRNDNTMHVDSSDDGVLECIESSSGLLANLLEKDQHNHNADTGRSRSVVSKLSTKELTSLFLQVHQQVAARRNYTNRSSDSHNCELTDNNCENEMGWKRFDQYLRINNTLSGLREIKKTYSPTHESFKDLLLTEHKILSQWRRRGDMKKYSNYTNS